MPKRNISLTILGISLMLISISIPFIKKEKDYHEVAVREQKIINYKDITNINNKEEKKIDLTDGDNYIAILEIPDLNIKNGLVNKYSKYNDVKYNVMILNGSNMPDIEKSNLILASHNGSSKVSYFRYLENIKEDSLIYIYYNGYKYIYKYNHSYEIPKTGQALIKRDRNVNTLTLITCKSNDDTHQVVYIAYLIKKEIY